MYIYILIDQVPGALKIRMLQVQGQGRSKCTSHKHFLVVNSMGMHDHPSRRMLKAQQDTHTLPNGHMPGMATQLPPCASGLLLLPRFTGDIVEHSGDNCGHWSFCPGGSFQHSLRQPQALIGRGFLHHEVADRRCLQFILPLQMAMTRADWE